MSKYEVKFTKQFKKDLKLLERKHKDITLLKQIVYKLANGEQLPIQNRDHELTNNIENVTFNHCAEVLFRKQNVKI